jgi:hypothetical protein
LYYINEIDQQIFMFCHPESQIVKKNQHIPRHIHTHTIKCRKKSHAIFRVGVFHSLARL